jgi:sigma-B regulation protein RsbU (phosphoserine phosphatase)
MPIRYKLLLLLICIALVPLIFAGWYAQSSTRELGKGLAKDFHDELVDRAEHKLALLAGLHGKILLGEGERVVLALKLQAAAVERALASAPYPDPKFYLATDFDRGDNVPPDTGPISAMHLRVGEDSRAERIPISLEAASFWLAPGVLTRDVKDDIARLAPLSTLSREIYLQHSDLLHWIYTALESGVHCSYPGHGGYPESFDPRKRHWYSLARDLGKATGNPPIVDASTRQVMITVSVPIRGPDGSFAGVTGIDVRLLDILDRIKAREDWTAKGQVILAAFEKGASRNRMKVLSQRAYLAVDRKWDVPVEVAILKEDHPAFQEMLTDLFEGRSGVRRMPYQGKDCLWGYSSLKDLQRTALFLVVPTEEVVADAREAEKQVLDRTGIQLVATGVTLLAVVVVVLLLSLQGSRVVTRPVSRLAAAAHSIARGDLKARAEVKSRDELGDLAQTFNAMVPQLEERMTLRRSLELAMQVQQALLPKGPPRLDGFDISGVCNFCDETGGDYYDFMLEGSALSIVVGDVTGHGVASALLMATARAMLRTHAHIAEDLPGLLAHVNRDLAHDTSGDRFMTLFCLVIDTEKQQLRWASAGHVPALVYGAQRDEFSELAGRDIPLGIDAEWNFHERSRQGFEIGEVILIGTDGIWETRNGTDEQFGMERLQETIRASASRTAEEIRDAITQAVDLFRGGRAQEDDVPLVFVKRVV